MRVPRAYPVCEQCGGEINPNKYEDSDRCYELPDGSVLCRECFILREEEYMRINTDDFAALVGVKVVGVA